VLSSPPKLHSRVSALLGAGLLAFAARAGESRSPAPTQSAASSSQQRPPQAESDSTLDPALQETTRRLLAAARPVKGGIVAVHAPTGRILVWQEYRRPGHTGHPLTEASTAAASLFKIVTTVALFERSPVLPTTSVCISGGEREIERFHLTPPRAVPNIRCQPFGQALGFSRNAVFAQLATEHLLRQDLVDVAERLGFNRPLPFDVPAQMGNLSVPYNDLEFARTAAGFQGSTLSVLGGAQLAYLIASGGRPRRMTLKAAPELAPPAFADDPPALRASTAERLRRMLEVTIHSGTSLEAFSDPRGVSYLGSIRVAGKTGTLRPSTQGPTASWFVGFAPSRSPELIVSVMLDNSPVWRRKANHVARDVMRAYFQNRPGVSFPFESL
jgi:penicillin-binding protein A